MSRLIGHYAPWILATMVGLLTLFTLVPAVAAYVPWPVFLVMLVVTVLLAVSVFAHNRRLCERCIASMPLNASTVASRYGLRFRVAHLFERRLFALGYLVALSVSSLLYSDPVGRYAWAAALASLVYLLLVYVTHQRLQPWCPRCRNGGEEHTAPTVPDPLSSGV